MSAFATSHALQLLPIVSSVLTVEVSVASWFMVIIVQSHSLGMNVRLAMAHLLFCWTRCSRAGLVLFAIAEGILTTSLQRAGCTVGADFAAEHLQRHESLACTT